MRGQRLTYHSWSVQRWRMCFFWYEYERSTECVGLSWVKSLRYATLLISGQSVGEHRAYGRGEGSTKCYGRCNRRRPGYFSECTVCMGVIPPHYQGWQYETVTETLTNTWKPSKAPLLIFILAAVFHSSSRSSLFHLLKTHLSSSLCFPSFLFSLSLSQRSHLAFPVLLSSNSLNIFGAVGTFFSITVPLITSVVLFLSTGMWTPSPQYN